MKHWPAGSIQDYLDRRSGKVVADAPIVVHEHNQKYIDALSEVFGLLAMSPTFQACILDFRTTYAMFYPVIWRESASSSSGTCDQLRRRIHLNTDAYDLLGLPEIFQTTAHEYRHAWQQTQKLAKFVFEHLQDQITYTRKIEGDAVAFQLTVAWELKELGHPKIWDDSVQILLRGAPESTKAFINAVEADPQSLWNGRAQNAVLLAWQQNRKRAAYYEVKGTGAFRHFNGMARGKKAILRSMVADHANIEVMLFKMPYAIMKDGKRISVVQREQYGRLTLLERRRLNAVTLPASRSQCAALSRFSNKP